jgi:hypothetical protein
MIRISLPRSYSRTPHAYLPNPRAPAKASRVFTRVVQGRP